MMMPIGADDNVSGVIGDGERKMIMRMRMWTIKFLE